MGRRSDHSREELYEMAMAEAEAIVVEEGWRKLTARSLAGRMGYSVGTLYNLFENADDILLHLNARTLDNLGKHLSEIDLSGDPKADLKRMLEVYLAFISENRNLWTVLFEHYRSDEEPVPEWYLECVGQVLALLEEALAPLFPEGKDAEKRRSARVLWSGLHGICSLAGSQKLGILTEEPVAALASDLINTYLSGLQDS